MTTATVYTNTTKLFYFFQDVQLKREEATEIPEEDPYDLEANDEYCNDILADP